MFDYFYCGLELLQYWNVYLLLSLIVFGFKLVVYSFNCYDVLFWRLRVFGCWCYLVTFVCVWLNLIMFSDLWISYLSWKFGLYKATFIYFVGSGLCLPTWWVLTWLFALCLLCDSVGVLRLSVCLYFILWFCLRWWCWFICCVWCLVSDCCLDV